MTTQERILKAIGERGLWKPIGKIHTWLYRLSGGRLGHTAGGISNLLLTTRGRRSGESRTVALAYMKDGDTYVLVASNGGSSRHPAWWLNLCQDPRATIQVAAETTEVEAREAEGEERARLWAALIRYNPPYAAYERMTSRRIPVVVLRRP
jgi:deazaflavin-dependent oxidoreductase (nitroreductase family)